MDVHLKIKYIDSKGQAYGLLLWYYVQYNPSIYLLIKYNMYLYNMA